MIKNQCSIQLHQQGSASTNAAGQKWWKRSSGVWSSSTSVLGASDVGWSGAATVLSDYYTAVHLLLLLFVGIFHLLPFQPSIPARPVRGTVNWHGPGKRSRVVSLKWLGCAKWSWRSSPLKVQKSPLESDGRFHSAGKLSGILTLLFKKQTHLFCVCFFIL